jgi:Fe-S cluster assembly protein SufD
MSVASLFAPLGELNDTDLLTTLRGQDEPEWLLERRAAAWQQFATSAPPIWKRTDMSKLRADQIKAPTAPSGTNVTWDATYASQGVVVARIADAVLSHSALIKQYLGTAVDATAHKFAALQAALWRDGLLIYVPKGVAVEAPIHATFSFGGGASAFFAHNLVILEPGASLTLIEEYTSPDMSAQSYAAPVTELFLGDGSMLRYTWIQAWGANVYHVGSQIAKVGNDATLEWAAVNLGGKLQHNESETYLGGNGAKVDWIASTFAGDGQVLLNAPWLRHVGANTDGHMDFKTVVNGGGYTTFDGMIKIEKGSRSTASRLEEHAIHLSPAARSDSIPGLKIDTNDVQRAGHASTSGQVDEEMLFYMRSRGIQREDAINLIVMGFFEPVLDRIVDETVRERIAHLIDAKI